MFVKALPHNPHERGEANVAGQHDCRPQLATAQIAKWEGDEYHVAFSHCTLPSNRLQYIGLPRRSGSRTSYSRQLAAGFPALRVALSSACLRSRRNRKFLLLYRPEVG